MERRIPAFRPSDLQGFLDNLIGELEEDDNSRVTWLNRNRHYYDRRYVRLDRGTVFPWPGASDIVMPLIDMTIEKLKAVYTRVNLGREISRFDARRPEVVAQAQYDTKFFNHYLRHSIRDFTAQMTISIDYMLQNGFAVTKTFWDYRTSKIRRTMRREDLFRRYIVTGELPPAARQASEQNFRARPIQAIQGNISLNALNAQTMANLRPLIAEDYGFDETVPKERKELTKLIRQVLQGEDNIVYNAVEVVANNSRTIALDPEDFIAGAQTTNLQTAERLAHRIFMNETEFVNKSEEMKWSPSAVNQIMEQRSDGSRSSGGSNWSQARFHTFTKDNREGVHTVERTADVEVWECHWWMDINNDKKLERVWAFIHPGTRLLLSDIQEEPAEHGRNPFDIVQFEMNDERMYSSRGVPEKSDDLDWETTLRHRAKLNKLEMLSPAFTRKMSSPLMAEDVHYIPGEFYNVNDHTDIAPIPVPDLTLPDEREELSLLGWNERYLGGLDILSSQQSISEARTATEVDAIRQTAQTVLQMRMGIFNIGFRDILDKHWDLFNQYGEANTYERVTGRPFIRKTKEEIRNDYVLVPVGTLEAANPLVESQRALQRFQFALQFQQANGGQNIIEGRFVLSPAEAFKQWLDAENIYTSDVIMREMTEQEQQQFAESQKQRQDLEERLDANIPVSFEEARSVVKDFKKAAPQGDRQRIAAG